MKVPVITHSHEGIRINISGIVETHGNPVYLAEAYARYKVTTSERYSELHANLIGLWDVIKLVKEELEVANTDRGGKLKAELSERMDRVTQACAELQKVVG